MPILADYFIVVSIPTDEASIEADGVEPEILFRYPENDHKKHRFPENAPFFCFPEGARVEYKSKESRKPFFFTFCFTVEDGSRSYGTTLYYFEPLSSLVPFVFLVVVDGEKRLNIEGKQLFVPKALCILSHQPMFSAFAIFLRELYRNAITVTEDVMGDESVSRIRRSSFNSKLRKGSTCNIVDDSIVSDCPIERQIRYFIDYCPSLDPSLSINLIVFQKLLSIVLPPEHCLPFTDRLCYEAMLNSLSSKNIIKVVACLLQEQRVLLVSSQIDTLTLCAEAFISLLYPFKWMHPLVPLLPTDLIEYLEAPTPYLMGVPSHVYESDECQSAIDGVIIVQLDFDKLIIPKNLNVETFPKPFLKKLEKFFNSSIPPPSTRILYCDHLTPLKASYLVFEVVFGPGRLGIKMKNRQQRLTETEAETEVVYLENVSDQDITIIGPGKKVALLRREPVILAVNGRNVIGLGLKAVVQILNEAARPLSLRLQIGTAPIHPMANVYGSMRVGSMELSPVSEGLMSDDQSSSSSSPIERKEEREEIQQSIDSEVREIDSIIMTPSSPLELSLDLVDISAVISPYSLRRSLSPRITSPIDLTEERVVRRYYRDRSQRGLLSNETDQTEAEEERDEDEDDVAEKTHAQFVEQLRVYFLLEMCELLRDYDKYICRRESD